MDMRGPFRDEGLTWRERLARRIRGRRIERVGRKGRDGRVNSAGRDSIYSEQFALSLLGFHLCRVCVDG